MRLVVLAVIGVALGVIVRVVLGRRSGTEESAPSLHVVPSTDRPTAPSAAPASPEQARDVSRPSPMAVAEEPRRPAPGLDASAGWEELTATSIGSRPDR